MLLIPGKVVLTWVKSWEEMPAHETESAQLKILGRKPTRVRRSTPVAL